MSTARLGFAVDSSQVKSAAVDLDRLTTSAGHVEQKTARLRDEFGRFVSAGHAAGRATEQVEQANDNAANAVTRHAMAIAKLTAAEARMGAASAASVHRLVPSWIASAQSTIRYLPHRRRMKESSTT